MPKEMIKAPLEKAPKNALDSFPFLKRHTHFPYKKITNYSFIFFFSFLLLHHSQVAFFCFIPFPSFACLLLVSSVSLCIYPPYQPHHHHIPPPSFPSSTPLQITHILIRSIVRVHHPWNRQTARALLFFLLRTLQSRFFMEQI